MENKNNHRNGGWPAARIVALVLGVGALAVGGEACDCNGSGPYYDGTQLHCGDCPQYAYRCQNGTVICAPDDYSAGLHHGCSSWTDKESCHPDPTGGTGGGDDGGDDESDDGAYDCRDWDPAAAVNYNANLRKWEIDEDFVDDLKADPFPITECDSARMKMVSGGYFEFYNIASGDLADVLGFQNGDVLWEVNGHDLLLPDDYQAALLDLEDDTYFYAKGQRGSIQFFNLYEIQ